MELDLQIGSYRTHTRAEGPGTRFAIWVQGCSLQCAGCFNPHFWNPRFGRTIPVQHLIELIVEAAQHYPELEGVTFLGGEPFEQSAPLVQIAQEVKKHQLSVMTFTGYTLEELEDKHHPDNKLRSDLLDSTDLLVDGRYEANNIDNERPWVGSKNQRFHFLSDRYSPDAIFTEIGDRIEITISSNGTAAVNGWATSDSLEKLLENL
jgi:anaerobic ribonucleoside-triphosphate reductase activating protein